MSTARARELVYGLYRRALHPELLPVAKSETVKGSVFKAQLMLLEDAGHAISFAATKHPASPVLLEVVTTSALELPRAGRVDLRPLAKAGRDRVKTKLDLLYECAYAIETCSAAEFARRHEKVLAAEPQGSRLLLDRGHPENDGPDPFSLIDFETKERSLEAFVVHAFPRERAFVFVQSSFGVAP
ncbi:MAG: DUF2617 family protein [Planctomycetota bacterium]